MDVSENFNPKVSIVIPVYNGGDYMRDAIDSALNQTYKNIEVVVINDGSKDKGITDSIAKEYGDRIRYFYKENGGVATALNLGIERMTGEYFSWLSHDDIYLPKKIEEQVKLLSALEDKKTVIYSGYKLMNANKTIYTTIDFLELYTQAQLDIKLFNVLRGLANGCTLLIEKSLFDIYGKFDASFPTTQDYRLWFEIFRHNPIKYSNKIDVVMRQHDMQGSKVIPSHIEECNSLWIFLLDQLTIEEMCHIEGTPELFYKKTYQFLLGTPYDEATQYCLELMQKPVDFKVSGELVQFLCKKYNELYECSNTNLSAEYFLVKKELEEINNSRTWRMLGKIRKIKNKMGL